ncbi:MAG: heavy metal translocating P-type ATPase [Calditerrivibrio sp.]|nr:heavy metal translocating P-type ATPase [Calditerrivibrio sp.]
MTTKNDLLIECSHCLLKIKRNTAILEKDEDGVERYFCCTGCHSVYHFVKTGGLERFYSIRKGYSPGSIKKVQVREELFKDDLRLIEKGMYLISFFISDIRCAACIWLIENSLKKLDGIKYVRVNYATHKMTVEYESEKIALQRILDTVTNLGYCPVPTILSSTSDLLEREKKEYFVRFAVASFFAMQLMLYSIALYAGYFQGIDKSLKFLFSFLSFLLATPVIFYSGKPFIINSIKSLKNRVLSMDILVSLGTLSAYFYSIFALFTEREIYFDSVAMIITLILLGRFIESSIKLKGSKELLILRSLQPRQVKKLNQIPTDLNNVEPIVERVENIKAGDLIVVYEQEIIPLDGEVVMGSAEVDESALTGESMPFEKKKGTIVFSGTKVISGVIVVSVLGDYKNSVLSKIVDALDSAQNTEFKTKRYVDKVISIFVPSVIAISLATFLYWFFSNGDITDGLIKAVSVLVISCPCALGIATPLALMIATSVSLKEGIVIKNGDILENMKEVKNIFFDKTGTLTEGVLKVSMIYPIDIPEKELIRIVASVEKNSRHPVAKAILDICFDELYELKEYKEVPGIGIYAKITPDIEVVVGNEKIVSYFNLKSLTLAIPEECKNDIQVCVYIDGTFKGMIFLRDHLKKEVPTLFMKWKNHGFSIEVLTGDNERSAKKVLEPILGYATIKAQLSPFQKGERIEALELSGVKTMFVGDGLNDSISIKKASVGIAMGSGSELAIETSDAVILNNSLFSVDKFISISKKTLKVIKENLFWAFIYNIIMIPLAATGYIHPIISAVFMSVSSIIVVLNSLRLKRI